MTDSRTRTPKEGMSAELTERLRAVRMVVMDVDGVLTDGGILLAADGAEMKCFNVKDGVGIKYLHRAGLLTAIITGRRSEVVARRAAELGIEEVRQGCLVKMDALREIMDGRGLKPDQVCFVGDDLPDLPLLRHVGVGVAVWDARPEVVEAADLVTKARGGQGALRELAELLLKAQDKWQDIMSRYV